jgi:conflict system STAND superfamily ATPase
MQNTDQSHKINRYPGVKPFSTNEKELFYARDKEISDLYGLMFIKQMIVLYGKSGNGKSSLINAGIIPKINEDDDYKYFIIRFNYYSNSIDNQSLSPIETITQRLSENLTPKKNSIINYILPGENSLWYWIKQNQEATNKQNYIIIFDQFEELFSYPKEDILAFSVQLSNLLYATIPTNYLIKIAELDENELVDEKSHDFLNNKPEVKILFSIRSDRLSLMNDLKEHLPSILQNCYELDSIDKAYASTAIIEPARLSQESIFKTPPFEYSDEVINKMIATTVDSKGKIETSTLQIICRYIEDTLVYKLNHPRITDDLLGDTTHIFQKYYEETLSKFKEEDRKNIQSLIEDGLIRNGHRDTISAKAILGNYGIGEDLLFILEESSLLRKERHAAGHLLYEVSHDNLIGAINNVADNRKVIEEERKKKKEEKERNRRKRRSTSIIIVMALALAGMTELAYNANSAKHRAEEFARKLSANQKIQAIMVLNEQKVKTENKKKYAKIIYEDANRLLAIGNKPDACLQYKAALDSLKDYPSDTLYLKVNEKIKILQCK